MIVVLKFLKVKQKRINITVRKIFCLQTENDDNEQENKTKKRELTNYLTISVVVHFNLVFNITLKI